MGSTSPVGWLIQLKVSVVVRPSGSVTVACNVVGREPLPPGASRPWLCMDETEVLEVPSKSVSLVNWPKLL